MKRILLPYIAALYSMLGVTAQAQKVSDPINECAFFAALGEQGEQGEQGGRVVEDGKGAAAETLHGQLVRTHCDLKLLPTPATKPMTAAEIYAAACDSVIVVSGVAKFGKDPKWQANPATAFAIDMARRSARQALQRIARHRVRIPIRLLIGIDRRLVAAMPPRHSPRTFVVDGTTLSMPDRPANQVAWPQSHSQKEGCGFPIMRLVGLFDLATGV